MAKVKKAKGKLEDGASLAEVVAFLAKGGTRIGQASDIETVDRIPTDHSQIDDALGGGFPRGRYAELFGNESSGKTLVALSAVAGCQRRGGKAAWVDAEHTYDPDWAAKMGVNNEELIMFSPNSGDEGYGVIEQLLATNELDLLVLDSVANMVPAAELAGEMGDAHMMLHARLNGAAMRKLTGLLSRTKTAMILINQVRSSGPANGGMGPQNVTTGGKAIPFFATVRISLRRIGYVKVGEDIVGGEFQMEFKKAKLTGMKAGRKLTFQVDFDHGLDFAQDVLEQAIEKGLVVNSGSWFTLGETRVQGEAKAKDFLRNNLTEWREKIANTETPEIVTDS